MALHVRYAVSLDFRKTYKLFCHKQMSDTFASKVFPELISCCWKKQFATGFSMDRFCTEFVRPYET